VLFHGTVGRSDSTVCSSDPLIVAAPRELHELHPHRRPAMLCRSNRYQSANSS